MALVSINRNPPRRELRIFAGLLGVFGVAVSVWLAVRHDAPRAGTSLALVTTLIALVGAIAPAWIRWLYVGWMTAVFPIGWVVSHAVLAVVYFLVVTPLGWVLRRRGHDPLALRLDHQATTYWTVRRPPAESDRYFRQF